MENPGRGGTERDPFSEHSSRYEAWFSDHPNVYRAELRAVRELMGPVGRSVEIGVGTGRFAVPLGVTWGVDPALPMLRTAREKGVEAVLGVGEALPFPDSAFDLALMVTTVCFITSTTFCLFWYFYTNTVRNMTSISFITSYT